MALEVNKFNYDEVISSDKPVILDFWAGWCVPCRSIAPIIDEIANEYEGKAIVGKVNVDDDGNNELALLYGVRNIPAVLYIKNGKLVDKQIGAAGKDVFVKKLEAIL
ncbi:MAG: thioredoxin [Prevotellaceae bacterium]|jgi:thioredoxin 1|nr:thioredoxin [Prevotellaceae bacterium]